MKFLSYIFYILGNGLRGATLNLLLTITCYLSVLTACANSSNNAPPVPTPTPDPTTNPTPNPTTNPTHACLAITNGIATTPQNFAAIVSINNAQGQSCTGTFVGTNTILTAAHCLSEQQVSGGPVLGGLTIKTANGGSIHPTAAYFPAWAGENNAKAFNDIAVLVAPASSAPAIMKIAPTAPTLGSEFTIAGYGTLTAAGSGNSSPNKLYFGKNTISALADDFIYSIGESGDANKSPTGQYSSGAPGDSGGPLIIGADIVGIETLGSDSSELLTDITKSGGPFLDEEDNVVALPNSTVSSLRQQVQSGRMLATDVHTSLTYPAYVTWLKGLAGQGLDIQFDTAGASTGNVTQVCPTSP